MTGLKLLDPVLRDRIECVCPHCGQIYNRLVEHEHVMSPWAYRKAGYLVITCPDCQRDFDIEKAQGDYNV